MSNPNDPIEMCRECHTLHPRSGPCSPVRIPAATEPWREGYSRWFAAALGHPAYSTGNAYAAGWRDVLALPELREVLEAADFYAKGLTLNPKRLQVALTALKARMGMP